MLAAVLVAQAAGNAGLRQSRLPLDDRPQGAAGPAGVVTERSGDAGGSGQPQNGDDQVAQAGHDARAVGGAHLGAILAGVHVADPGEPVFDAPVAADDGRERGRAGLGDSERGDGVAGLAGPLPFHFAAAHDLDGLGGAGEGQAPGHGGDFQGAPLGTAVPAFRINLGPGMRDADDRDRAGARGWEAVDSVRACITSRIRPSGRASDDAAPA